MGGLLPGSWHTQEEEQNRSAAIGDEHTAGPVSGTLSAMQLWYRYCHQR